MVEALNSGGSKRFGFVLRQISAPCHTCTWKLTFDRPPD